MTLQDRLAKLEEYNLGQDPITEEPFTPEETMDYYKELKQLAQQIEKDILELIGGDEPMPEKTVYGVDGRKQYAKGQSASSVKARNELRAELRLKLKEYIGTLDRSTNSNDKLIDANKENN
jgi:hypothetical protein